MLFWEDTEPDDLLVCFAVVESSDLLVTSFDVGEYMGTELGMGAEALRFLYLFLSLMKWKQPILQTGRRSPITQGAAF